MASQPFIQKESLFCASFIGSSIKPIYLCFIGSCNIFDILFQDMINLFCKYLLSTFLNLITSHVALYIAMTELADLISFST